MSDLIDRQDTIDANPSPFSHDHENDLISRQQAIDALKERFYKYGRFAKIEELVWSIEKLPSVQPEPCEDAVSRNAIIQKLNTMDRYVSEELRLCNTDKKFSKNEVFIVDDVYEEIVENLPSAQLEPQWIPVSERFPEVGSEVLVCYDFKGKRSVYIADFYGDGDFHGLDDEYLTPEGRKYRKAVAWMSLPEPYIPERSDKE